MPSNVQQAREELKKLKTLIARGSVDSSSLYIKDKYSTLKKELDDYFNETGDASVYAGLEPNVPITPMSTEAKDYAEGARQAWNKVQNSPQIKAPIDLYDRSSATVPMSTITQQKNKPQDRVTSPIVNIPSKDTGPQPVQVTYADNDIRFDDENVTSKYVRNVLNNFKQYLKAGNTDYASMYGYLERQLANAEKVYNNQKLAINATKTTKSIFNPEFYTDRYEEEVKKAELESGAAATFIREAPKVMNSIKKAYDASIAAANARAPSVASVLYPDSNNIMAGLQNGTDASDTKAIAAHIKSVAEADVNTSVAYMQAVNALSDKSANKAMAESLYNNAVKPFNDMQQHAAQFKSYGSTAYTYYRYIYFNGLLSNTDYNVIQPGVGNRRAAMMQFNAECNKNNAMQNFEQGTINSAEDILAQFNTKGASLWNKN